MNDGMDPEGGGAQASALERRLARGLQFADMLGFTNQQETRENRVTVEALAELLIAKGVLRLRELEERKQAIARADEEERRHPAVHLVATGDKYAAAGAAPIDCENRLHLCRARCCKLWFALSVQDLEERIVRWNYARPYAVAQRADGYCVHQAAGDGHRCGIYQHRPLVCRTYSCREDQRIWLDFERYVPNPDIAREDWPRGGGQAGDAAAASPAED
jgi:Fe-S-cluster containining protein